MTIKYYLVTEYGEIGSYEIDTTDREYKSHTDDVVLINEGCGKPTSYTRNFEDAKADLIDSIKEQLAAAYKLTEDSI